MKRKILIFIIFVLYATSFGMFMISRYSVVNAGNSEDFNNRVANTKLK